MDEQNMGVKPSGAGNKMWYVVGVAVLLLLAGGIFSGFFSRGLNEEAIEQTTEGNVQVNPNGSVTYSNNQGTVSTSNNLPENWPSDAPTYLAGTIVYSGFSNQGSGGGTAVIINTEDSVEQVRTYYKNTLVSNGWKITDEASVNGTYAIVAEKSGKKYAITIVRVGNQTQITSGIENL